VDIAAPPDARGVSVKRVTELSISAAARYLPAQKWRVLSLMVVVQAFVIGIGMYSFTFWVEPWIAEFGASRRDVLTAISLMTYTMGLMSLFAGRWIDLYPAKYVVTTGMIGFVVGMLIVSLAPTLWVIWLTYALVLPASAALCGPLIAMVLVSRNFEARRGLAIGIVTLGTSLGGVVFPIIIALLLGAIGWRSSYVVLGLAATVLVPLCWIILSGEKDNKLASASADATGGNFRDFAGRYEFWILAVIYLFTWFVFTSVQHNVRPFSSDLGISVEQSATFISTLAFWMIVGKIVTGALSDKYDNRYLFIGAAALMAAAVVSLSYSATYTQALISFTIMGLAAGAFLPLQGTLYAATFGPEAMGRAMGMAAPIQSLSAFGAFFAGWARDSLGSYALFFQFAALLLFLAAPLLLMLAAPKREKAADKE